MSEDAGSARVSLQIERNGDEFAVHVATFVEHAAQLAIHRRGRFTVALSGGSTPRDAYARLAESGRQNPIDWKRSFVFFCDERFVPYSDPDSNFGMVQRAILEPASVPVDQVFPISTSFATAAESAQDYEARLMKFFDTHDKSVPPRIDLVVLGVGEDGHTASLFPGSAAVEVADRWAAATPPGMLPPKVDRVTLTLPVINAAREVLFLAAGPQKAQVVHDLIDGCTARSDLPAARVLPVDGHVTWIVDRDAARLLKTSGSAADAKNH